MEQERIFHLEESAIKEAEALLEDPTHGDAPLLPHYAELLKQYKKLFAQTKGIVRMSDRFQERLNQTNQELERTSAELAEARRLAEAATQAKSEFLANMSHEIRTPMNAILGFASLGMKLPLTPKVRNYLQTISTAGHSLLGIINDLLDFSKIEAGKMDLETIPFRLNDVLGNVADLFAHKAAEKDLELILAPAEEVPETLVGDALRLGQVLINLVNNALKFTEEGHVLVRVERLPCTGDHARLRFSVQDTGLGMTPEQMEKLFQAFSQADASTTRKFGGTGLGLTISKRLVEMAGGEIWAESQSGRGSTFFFTAEFPLAASGTDSPREIPLDWRGLNLLVVDDNAMAREVLCEHLRRIGFEARCLASGEEALRDLERSAPERLPGLILLDRKMPGMDGLETARQIKRHHDLARIPILLMVSVLETEAFLKPARELGLQGFLAKPFLPSRLVDALLEASLDQACAQATAPDLVRINFHGARVLLAEDNPINQMLVREILEGAGLRVDLANNGLEAVRMVDQFAYGAILMDVHMPEMDGWQATAKIREKTQHEDLPIIAMTAHAVAGYREECLAAGMSDYLTKPIDPELMLEILGRWVPLKPTRSELPHEGNLEAFAQLLPWMDVPAVMARVNHNQDLLKQILRRFLEEKVLPEEQIREAMLRGDREAAFRSVHSLKGAAGQLGLGELFEAARCLEEVLREESGEDWTPLLAELALADQAFRSGLAAFFATRIPAVPVRSEVGGGSDRSRQQASLAELALHLGRNSLLARQPLAELRGLPGPAGYHEALDLIETSLTRLDFKSALHSLQSLQGYREADPDQTHPSQS